MNRNHYFIQAIRLSALLFVFLFTSSWGQVILDQRSNGIALGDVNHDGVLDLVVVTNTFNLVCLGNPNVQRITRAQCSAISDSVLKSNDVALGDLNEDGHLDAVFANGNRGEPQRNRFCLGDGAGGFTCLLVDSKIRTSNAVALDDLNRDGHLDAVFANDAILTRSPNHVCYGNGTQQPFSDDQCEPVSNDIERSKDVALADVNRDGNLDVVFVGEGVRQLCSGNRTGTFNCNDITTEVGSTNAVGLWDINGDRQVDAVFANEGEFNEVCLGSGSRAFSCHPIESSGLNGSGMDVGDFNSDGMLDIVFSNQAPSRNDLEQNRMCFGDGQGAFQCEPLDGDDDGGSDVALGDLNQDGVLDVVFARSVAFADSADRVCFGNGGLQPFVAIQCNLIGSDEIDSRGVAIADMNADGHLDVVLANNDGRNWLCLGDGSAGFFNNLGACVDISVRVDDSLGVAVGDLNGDGLMDAVFANGNFNGQKNEICLGGSDVRFGASNCTDVSQDAFGSENVSLADVNTDGRLDLIFFNPSSIDRHRLCLNEFISFSCVDFGLDDAREIAFADVNQDGYMDAVFDTDTQHQICLGNGTMTLIEDARCHTFGMAVPLNKQLALGDLDNDGLIDVVFPNEACLGIAEAPYFGACVTIDLGVVRKIALGDLNADGFLDGVVVNAELNQVCIGDGTTTTFSDNCQDLPTAVRRSVDVDLGDLNEDGFLDAIFINGPFELNQVCLGDAFARLTCEDVSGRLPQN